jgi:addiction module HigA family antidote
MGKPTESKNNYAEGDLLPLITPGQILFHEFMEPYGLSMNSLAKNLNISPTAVSEIVRGERSITTLTAIRLSLCFDTTPQFWTNLQQQHDIEEAMRESLDKLQKEVTRVKDLVVH